MENITDQTGLKYHLIRFKVIIGEYELLLARVVSSYEEDSDIIAHEYIMSYWGKEVTRCEAKNEIYYVWNDEIAIRQLAAHTITKEEYEVLNNYLY